MTYTLTSAVNVKSVSYLFKAQQCHHAYKYSTVSCYLTGHVIINRRVWYFLGHMISNVQSLILNKRQIFKVSWLNVSVKTIFNILKIRRNAPDCFLAHLAFCHLLASSVNFSHFNFLLWNPSAKWTETW